MRRLATIAIAACLGALGCADDEPRRVDCSGSCTCPAGSDCRFDCGTEGCLLAECLGGRCTATCPGGRCALDCDAMSSCSYDCAGGRCSTDCDRESDCELTCSGGDCQLLCDAASTCTLDCTGAATTCRLLCEAGGHGTCIGNCNVPSCD